MKTGNKKGAIEAFLDGFPNAVSCQRILGGITFHWSRKGIGRGILTLRVTRGRLEVDDECMNSDVCAAVVKQAIDEASWNTKVSGPAQPGSL